MIQAIVIVLLFTMPVMYALRKLLANRVQKLMLRTSPKVKPAASTPDGIKEVEAPVPLEVLRLSSDSASAASDEARHAGAAAAISLFRRWCIYDAISLLAALAAWYLAQWYRFNHLHNLDDFHLQQIAIFYLVLIVVRYIIYVRQYRNSNIRGTKIQGWFKRWILVGPKFLLRLYIDPKYSWYPLFSIVYILYEIGSQQNLLNHSRYYAFPLFVLVAFISQLVLRLHLDRLAQKGINRKLLILRVFGQDENSKLTFGALREAWQHIGSTFTVVDPSFIRYKYRSNSEAQVAIVFFSALAWVYVYGTPEFNEWWSIAIILSILIISGYAIASVVLYTRAPGFFAANDEEIQGRLQRLMRRPRRWDLTFKDFDLYGFANTWKDAVSRFVAEADVVVMDLRGFSAENKGCETEIDLLFDSKPLDKLVFVVNSDTDLAAVEKTLHERWQYLRTDSPNFAVVRPSTNIYMSADESDVDIKGLVNLLFSCATHSPEKHNEI